MDEMKIELPLGKLMELVKAQLLLDTTKKLLTRLDCYGTLADLRLLRLLLEVEE